MTINLKATRWYSYKRILDVLKKNALTISGKFLCDTNSAGSKCSGGYGMNIANKLENSGYQIILN